MDTTLATLHVKDATYDGFRGALEAVPGGAGAFSWESTERGPALLFLGTGLANKTLAQNIWFEFDKYLNTVTYTVRLLEMATGDNRGIFTAQVSWAEAAVLLDACIEQVLAEQALEQQRYTLRRKGM